MNNRNNSDARNKQSHIVFFKIPKKQPDKLLLSTIENCRDDHPGMQLTLDYVNEVHKAAQPRYVYFDDGKNGRSSAIASRVTEKTLPKSFPSLQEICLFKIQMEVFHGNKDLNENAKELPDELKSNLQLI